jgi:hypothetical protein
MIEDLLPALTLVEFSLCLDKLLDKLAGCELSLLELLGLSQTAFKRSLDIRFKQLAQLLAVHPLLLVLQTQGMLLCLLATLIKFLLHKKVLIHEILEMF